MAMTNASEGPAAARITGAIITMAHALGMRVVAEGVETLAQVRLLRSLECDEVQGYYISRPLPAQALSVSLRGPARNPSASSVDS